MFYIDTSPQILYACPLDIVPAFIVTSVEPVKRYKGTIFEFPYPKAVKLFRAAAGNGKVKIAVLSPLVAETARVK